MATFPSAVAGDSELYIAVNNKVTNLSAGIDDSTLTIPVASTTGFPANGFISIDNEIIHYTSVGASQFNADLRGADGSTNAAHLNGTQVSHNIIAAHHNAGKEEIKAIEQNLNDRIGLHATQVILQADLNANSKKIASLAAGTTSGDAIRYEQLIGVYLPLAGGTMTGVTLIPNGTNLAPALAFSSNSDTGLFLTGSDIEFSINSSSKLRIRDSSSDIYVAYSITPSNTSMNLGNSSNYFGKLYTLGIKGTATNDSATAGDVGEVVSSAVGATNLPSSGDFGDLTSISLTAGDWLVSLNTVGFVAATTTTYFQCGVSTSSGNSSTGLTDGDTRVYAGQSTAFPATALPSMAVVSKRFSLASTTTIYLKYMALYSAGTPTMAGRITAVRIR